MLCFTESKYGSCFCETQTFYPKLCLFIIWKVSVRFRLRVTLRHPSAVLVSVRLKYFIVNFVFSIVFRISCCQSLNWVDLHNCCCALRYGFRLLIALHFFTSPWIEHTRNCVTTTDFCLFLSTRPFFHRNFMFSMLCTIFCVSTPWNYISIIYSCVLRYVTTTNSRLCLSQPYCSCESQILYYHIGNLCVELESHDNYTITLGCNVTTSILLSQTLYYENCFKVN